MIIPFKKIGTICVASILTFCSHYGAIAAPGVLPDVPLFISTAVQPNIFFTVDDSGSMGWETIVDEGTAGFSTSGGRPIVRGFTIEFYAPSWWTDRDVLPQNDIVPGTWVFRNHHGNKNYYNPDTTYKPWAGTELNGDPMYQEATDIYKATDTGTQLTVPRNPYSSSPDTLDLTANFDYYLYQPFNSNSGDATLYPNSYYIPTYYEWIDDGDGVFETGEEIEHKIAAGSIEMDNFANWFVYYRTREFASKAAIGEVIFKTNNARMGMEAMHGGKIQDLAKMEDGTNKYNLLKEYYSENSEGGTPSHQTLKRVGDYFTKTDGSVIVSKADGGECQQNFNLFLSDGFWNSFVSPDVGNADQDNSTDASVYDGNLSQSNDFGNYADSFSNTLADLTMHYYETDLRGDLDDNVPIPDKPYADGRTGPSHQHLVTYTIGFGLEGTLEAGVEPEDPLFTGWPEPKSGQQTTVDDLRHAAYNARGVYLSAKNHEELLNSLSSALADISDLTATASAASVTSAQLSTESSLYIAEFNSSPWQGTIYAYGIKDLVTGELNDLPDWSAAEELAKKNIANRVILTYDTDSTPSQGIPFTDFTNLPISIKNDLSTDSTGSQDALGSDRLDYIRGDHSNEGSGNDNFRERAILSNNAKSRLGDIINAGPVYVSQPGVRWPDEFPVNNPSEPYSKYVNDEKDRTGVVYVGANDGMLHGFDGASGEELLAYIPSNLFSTETKAGLHYLTEKNYTHRYYNDLTPSVSDVFFNNKWHTVLIGGQRSGGRGYFALDVTNPDDFSASNAANIALWEFTHEDLGFTHSRPQIGMMNDGTWVAVFGNGYNHTGVSSETGGEAQLFIVNIETGALVKRISTDSGTVTERNGLAEPALADLDGNGTIDRAYAGDLEGNMWAFDLSGASVSSWGLAYTDPLFVTSNPVDATGAQAITTKPTLSFHPKIATVEEPDSQSNEPNLMVYFGSGQYLVDADKLPSADSYFYGVWDKGGAASQYPRDRNDLIEQTISTVTDDGVDYRVLTENSVNYSDSSVHGWKIFLPDSGERIVTNPIARGGIVFFNSSVPTDDPCLAGGYGYRFGVDLATGGAPDFPVFDTDGNGIVDGSDKVGTIQIASATKLNGLPTHNTLTDSVGYTKDDPFVIVELPKVKQGRFSWQELLR